MNTSLERILSFTTGPATWGNDTAAIAPEPIQKRSGYTDEQALNREVILRLEERSQERARIARELHDTLLQGFFCASMLLNDAVEQVPADSPSKESLKRALCMVQRVLEEGRVVLQGLRGRAIRASNLEQELSELGDDLTNSGRGGFRILVMGRPRKLQTLIKEQIYLIAREALANARHHSHATSIEAEVEYLPGGVRVVVRDNGIGIDPQVLRWGRESHWGLQGMRERAKSVGAQLKIWSRQGAGTEVEISASGNFCLDDWVDLSESQSLPGEVVA